MKRFLADVLLILLLVSIGSYINQEDSIFERADFSDKIADFEDDVAQHQIVTPKQTSGTLQDIKENNASRLAQSGSEFVVGTIHGTVGILAEVFGGILE